MTQQGAVYKRYSERASTTKANSLLMSNKLTLLSSNSPKLVKTTYLESAKTITNNLNKILDEMKEGFSQSANTQTCYMDEARCEALDGMFDSIDKTMKELILAIVKNQTAVNSNAIGDMAKEYLTADEVATKATELGTVGGKLRTWAKDNKLMEGLTF